MSANGFLTSAELVTVDGYQLAPTTAAKWAAFKTELIAVTGITPIVTLPDGAYRSYSRQLVVKAQYGPLAATPGYSNHGLGRAFDVNNIGHYQQAVIDAVANKHGLFRDGYVAGKAESWHYHDIDGIMPAETQHTLIPTETTTPTEEDNENMGYPIYAKGDKAAAVYAVYVTAGDSNSPNGFSEGVYCARRMVDRGEFDIVSAVGYPHPKQTVLITIPQAEFDSIPKVVGSP